ncbi:MAG: clostripain-related cysteine peptidase [Chloroflexota bacterium]
MRIRNVELRVMGMRITGTRNIELRNKFRRVMNKRHQLQAKVSTVNFSPIFLHFLLAVLLLLSGSKSAVALVLTNALPSEHSDVTFSGEPSSEALCTGVTRISEEECNVLVALYQQTDGEQWHNRTNWLTIDETVSPCEWYGVTCEGQHVTALNLASNRLSGQFSARFAALPMLNELVLNDNQLRGTIPLAICRLAETLEVVHVEYNQLTAANRRAKECLDQLNPQWLTTQTIPPTDLKPTRFMTDTIELSWTSIPYTADGGYYEISYTSRHNQPFTVHGTTTNKRSGSYLLDGLTPGQMYTIRIRTYTPAHAQQENEQWSDAKFTVSTTKSTDDDVLLLVYFPADNDLSPYVPSVVRRLEYGSRLNPNVRVLMLTDQAGDQNTNLLDISEGQITPSSAIQSTWGTNELDTTDPAVLAWFLKNARTLYPASRTVVSIMGHGVGWTPEFTWQMGQAPEETLLPEGGIPALPKGLHATPGDVTDNGGFLSTLDLAHALAEATDNGENPFDLIFFDQCFQGNLDVLYEMRETAQVFVSSPSYAFLSAPYHQYLPFLTPAKTTEEMANAIIHIYQNSLNEHHPNAIFWASKDDIEAVADAVSTLGMALLDATNAGQDARILQASLESKYVDTTQCGRQNLILGPPDELLGAGTFAQNLKRLFPANSGVEAAADGVIQALENIEGNAQVGRPYLAPETIWDYDDTFTILAPLLRDAPASVVWRASIYTEESPLTATWTPVPTQTVSITGTFAFIQDGEWDEFINAWYTNDLEPTVGDWCHYTPPIIVRHTVTEPLSLELTRLDDRVTLVWGDTAEENAVEYWILARQGDGNWRTVEVADLTQTNYTFTPPLADRSYHFQVVAQSELGVAVAQSNEATLSADDTTDAHFLYLPLISSE